jgi:hypothetical protein
MPRAAVLITSPNPPGALPSAIRCTGSTAMVKSASPDTTGWIKGTQFAADSPKSASSRSSVPTSGRSSRDSSTPRALTPDSTAAALPRLRLCETTMAPAAAACDAVLSLLPSSQTITS